MSMIDRQTDASAKLPVLTKIIIVAVLTPAILQLGPLTLSPSRIIFLFLVPFVFFRIVSGKYGGFLLSDFILIAFLGWFGLAMLINNPDKAVSFTGMNAVIALGGYFLARSSITNVETFRAALKFILLVVMVLLPFAIFEAVTNEFVIPKLISAIPESGLSQMSVTTEGWVLRARRWFLLIRFCSGCSMQSGWGHIFLLSSL